MIVEDAVSAAAQLAVPVTKKDLSRGVRRLSRLHRQLITAEVQQGLLLPIEKAAHAKLGERIQELTGEIKLAKQDFVSLMKYRGYKRLSHEPLQWRNHQNAPRLILFSIDSPVFAFFANTSVARVDGAVTVETGCLPALPAALQCHYADVLTMMENWARKQKKSTTISTEFTGVIPESAKMHIAHARTIFPQLFLLAEVKAWRQEERAPTEVDPLVVGFMNDSLWLVHAFDTTPTEEYIQREFTFNHD